LHAAHAAGDDRVAELRARSGADALPASTIASKASTTLKRPKAAPKKALGARSARPDDPTFRSPNRGWWATRASRRTNRRPRLQLDALRAAGCVVIRESAASDVSRSRPALSRALADLSESDAANGDRR
jgi:hypothetical protein